MSCGIPEKSALKGVMVRDGHVVPAACISGWLEAGALAAIFDEEEQGCSPGRTEQ